MIKRLLIANRGEIATRIIRTCRRLGIEAVTVYSDADADHPHTELADQSYYLGPSPASESYLRIEKILEIAKRSGAEAIHPGYGFLSESTAFARACAQSGIIFVGPSAETMAALGNKDAARKAAEKIGVPVIPGYDGQRQDTSTLRTVVKKLGLPVLLKARAGGGGKGMRLVQNADELESLIVAAGREAEAFFGDPHLIVEKVIDHPRHIEIQVIGDSLGNVVHLFERDCTLQRRHQKIIEESPSPLLPQSTREKMCEAALRLAKSCKLSNAATFEFLLDEHGQFYFLEANCRIQVEHPVTELITKLDLIELQIRVAQGEQLPVTQQAITCSGVAIESRIYAESPERGFIPRPGTINLLQLPENSPFVRVDHALSKGTKISTFYDAMVAKIICWGENRDLAIARSVAAIRQLKILPLENNQQFLIRLLEHPAVRASDIYTTFVDEKLHELIAPPAVDLTTAESAAVAEVFKICRTFVTGNRGNLDPFSRLSTYAEFTFNRDSSFPPIHWRVCDEQRNIDITHSVQCKNVERCGRGLVFNMEIDGQKLSLDLPQIPPDLDIKFQISGRSLELQIDTTSTPDGEQTIIRSSMVRYRVEKRRELASQMIGVEKSLVVASPLPGKLIAIRVKQGSTVSIGSVVAVIESMKMEHTLQSPIAGTIAEILAKQGSNVYEGEVIARIDPGQ